MNHPDQDRLTPASMEELLGYPRINCEHQCPVEHSIVLKHNRYFFIADAHGNIEPPGHCSLGLYHDDTRVLSHYSLSFHGGPPSLLSAQIMRSFTGQIDMAIKDTDFGGDNWDPKNGIHIRREILIAEGLVERITLTNYLTEPLDYWFEMELGCDFADIFEVRGWKRKNRGQYFAPVVGESGLSYHYKGIDGTMIRSSIRFGGHLPKLDSKRARWEFHMPPNTQFQTQWEVCADGKRDILANGHRFDAKHKEVDDIYGVWQESCTCWDTPIADFRDMINRSVDDLRALHIEIENTSVISAGIPWFSTIFGRDSIITSLQTLSLNPGIARSTLYYLARHQGNRSDEFTAEQPGKIMHELRRGEMARSREIPHLPYYGTIDATPLWIVLLSETWKWTGDTRMVNELFPHAERAMEWIDRHGDIDGDGFVEYRNGSEGGLANQGWKDSGDGVPFPDASLPEPPIALVEVQGYVYDAKVRMAELCEMLGKQPRAKELREQAAALRKKIVSSYWMDDAGTFGLALDGEKRLLPVVTSNAGHLLWSGVPDHEQARRTMEAMLAPEMNSGWGIRTLSSAHRVFNPMSYHNGSIWPHDNSIIIMGLSRYCLADRALSVVRGLYEAAIHDEFLRLPELYCGMPRSRGKQPILYPVSCCPQAWASGSFFLLLQAMLGIHAEAPEGSLLIRNPVLPDFLDELTLTNLRVGNSLVSLQFRRYHDRTFANLLSRAGEPLEVRIELT